MAYTSNLFGGGAAPSLSGSPSAFTSPGLPPQALAMLLAMQNGSTGSAPPGAPMLPAAPKTGAGLGAPSMVPPPQVPQQPNILQLLGSLNPQLLQHMLGRAAGGAFGGGFPGGAPGMGLGGSPGPGTGGLY